MNTHALNAQTLELLKQFPNTEPMPALFLGRGSPLDAVLRTGRFRGDGAGDGRARRQNAQTARHFVHLRALGNARHMAHRHAQSAYHPRFWRLSAGAV